MKTTIRFLLLSAATMLAPLSVQAAAPVYVYKVAVSLPVIRIVNNGTINKLETKTLTANDVVNIALGKKLGTPLGTMVLAAASPEDFSQAKLIIYDLGTKTITKELVVLSSLDLDTYAPASSERVFGFGTGPLSDTGPSTTAKFYPATLHAGASVSGSSDPIIFNPRLAGGLASVHGRMTFDYTDAKSQAVHFDGIIVNGKLTVSGKTIAIQ